MTRAWETPQAAAPQARAAAIRAEVPVLETARLTLRAPRAEDFAAYEAILCSARAKDIGGPFTREEAWLDFCQFTASWMLRGYGVWTLCRKGEEKALGFSAICQEFEDPEVELGWLLVEEAEGHGYAREAARAVRDHAFATLGLPTLVSYIAHENAPSRRIAEDLGAAQDAAAPVIHPDLVIYRHAPAEGVSS